MGRKDTNASLEEAYIARFRGRSIASRHALVDIDLQAERAVSNTVALETFLARYKKEAGTELNRLDARFYALYSEGFNRPHKAKAWYQVLDSLGDEWSLRGFYIRWGMTTEALERFKTLRSDEFLSIIDGNLKRLMRQKKYESHLLEETLKACTVGQRREQLHALLTQCLRDAQIRPSARVAKVMGRELTEVEANKLGEALIRKRLHEPQTYAYVKRIPGLGLATSYLDALIEDSGGRADIVLGYAEDLGYTLSTEQLEKLYEKVQAEIKEHFDAIHPNMWVPIVEELARRVPAWQEKLADAYETASQQAQRRLRTAAADYYAEKQGLPLRPIELCIQYQCLNDPRYKKGQGATKPFTRARLLKALQEKLSLPPLGEDGKPKPD